MAFRARSLGILQKTFLFTGSGLLHKPEANQCYTFYSSANEDNRRFKMATLISSTLSNDDIIFRPNSSPPLSPARDATESIHGLHSWNLAGSSSVMPSSNGVYVHFMIQQLGFYPWDIDYLASKPVDSGIVKSLRMAGEAIAGLDCILPDIKSAYYAAGPPKDYDWGVKLISLPEYQAVGNELMLGLKDLIKTAAKLMMFFPLQKGYQQFIAVTSKEVDSLVPRLTSMPAQLAVSRLCEMHRHYTNELDIQRSAGKIHANGVAVGDDAGPLVIEFYHQDVDLTSNDNEPYDFTEDQCHETASRDPSVMYSAAIRAVLSRNLSGLGINQHVESTNYGQNSEHQSLKRHIAPKPPTIPAILLKYRCLPLKLVVSDLISLRDEAEELADRHSEGSSIILDGLNTIIDMTLRERLEDHNIRYKLFKAEILMDVKKEYTARLQNAIKIFSQGSKPKENQQEVGYTKPAVVQDNLTETDSESQVNTLRFLQNENLELRLQIKEFEAQIHGFEMDSYGLQLKSQELQDALYESRKENNDFKEEINLIQQLEREDSWRLRYRITILEAEVKEKSEECGRLQAEFDKHKHCSRVENPYGDTISPKQTQSQFMPWIRSHL